MITQAYHWLTLLTMGALVLMALLCLLRCIRGPRTADRVMAVNMIGTLTILMIAILILMLGEGYLADITLIYATLSFLAVVVLCKVYTGFYREKQHAIQMKERGEGGTGEAFRKTEDLIAADPVQPAKPTAKEVQP